MAGLDTTSRGYATCGHNDTQLGQARVEVHSNALRKKLLAKKMDARVISAFARVSTRLCPRMTSRQLVAMSGVCGVGWLMVAWRSDPAAHPPQMARYGNIRDTADQICHRHWAMRDLVATVDAVGAIVTEHVHVSGRHPDFRFVRKRRLRIARIDVGLLRHDAVDDRAAALDCDDAFDVVKLLLLGMDVDCDLDAARMPGAIVRGVGEKIFIQAQRGLHACTRGVQPQQPARCFRVHGINARAREYQTSEYK